MHNLQDHDFKVYLYVLYNKIAINFLINRIKYEEEIVFVVCRSFGEFVDVVVVVVFVMMIASTALCEKIYGQLDIDKTHHDQQPTFSFRLFTFRLRNNNRASAV